MDGARLSLHDILPPPGEELIERDPAITRGVELVQQPLERVRRRDVVGRVVWSVWALQTGGGRPLSSCHVCCRECQDGEMEGW